MLPFSGDKWNSFKRSFAIALMMLCAPSVGLAATQDGSGQIDSQPTESIDGFSNFPPVGRSLFDTLFQTDVVSGEYEIPYPFSEVITSLQGDLGISINGDENVIKSVLIPLGRCINRYAAKPDYFKFPRLVIAADSEHYGQDYLDQPYLRDRLFIGYQNRTDSMEVISYNDEAGRFEFQIVSNYKAGQRPQVSYAERATCMACHQNAGPIFSQPPWDETDQNQGIYQLMVDALPESDYVSPQLRRSNAVDIDGASNRANLFPMFQEFWRGVCETPSFSDEIRCRAGMLEAVLRYRLQERSRSLPGSPLITKYLAPIFNNNNDEKWPNGISIPSSDIPNLNPLFYGADAHLESAQLLKEPRSLMISWQTRNFFRGLEGIGNLIPLADFRRLDRRLYQLASSNSHSSVQLKGPCQLYREDEIEDRIDGLPQTGDISFDCELDEGSVSRQYQFLGDLYVEYGELNALPVFSRLVLDSQSSIIGLTHSGGKIQEEQNRWILRLDLRDAKQQFYARVPGGGIIDQVEIAWPRVIGKDDLFNTNSRISGSVTLSILPDFEALDIAISELIADAEDGETRLLSSGPFRGAQIMDALIEKLDQIPVPNG